jgi:hypothetical protein
MAKKKYVVELTDEERAELKDLISAGQESARKLRRARILLKVDAGWTDTNSSCLRKQSHLDKIIDILPL